MIEQNHSLESRVKMLEDVVLALIHQNKNLMEFDEELLLQHFECNQQEGKIRCGGSPCMNHSE